MRTRIRQLDSQQAYGIWFYDIKGKDYYLAKPVDLIFEKIHETEMYPSPTLTVNFDYAQEFLQSLVNALIEQGVRPNNDKTAGELEATKKHLQDLQKYIDILLTK